MGTEGTVLLSDSSLISSQRGFDSRKLPVVTEYNVPIPAIQISPEHSVS
jgi:hypothetical protein